MPAIVDEEKCTGCGICEDTCSVGAIKVDGEKAHVGDECTECGDCVNECPSEAITLP